MLSAVASGADSQEQLKNCQFDDSGNYSVTDCIVEPIKIEDSIGFYTAESRVSPTGSAEWLEDWYATWLAIEIGIPEQSFVTGCYDGGSGVSVCTSNKTVFDQLTSVSEGYDRSSSCPEDDDCLTEHEFVYDVARSQLPSKFLDTIETSGSCTTDLTYTDQDGFTHTEEIEGEFRYSTDNIYGGLVCLHTASRPSDFTNPPSEWRTRTFDADPTEITGGTVRFTVPADLELAYPSSNDDVAGESGGETGSGSDSEGSSAETDGSDSSTEGNTGSGSGTVDGGDASIGETIDTTIIAFIQSTVDAVRDIIGV